MMRSRLGLKALALCGALVGMFAFAGAAQATSGALWKIGGAQAKGGEAVEAKTDVAFTLLTELGGKQVHIKCPTINLVGAKLVEPNGGFTGRIDFKGCKFFFLKTIGGELIEEISCEPRAEGVKGLIVTNSITGLVVLHTPSGGTKEGVLELKPTSAGALLVTIPLGEECGGGEELKVGGVLFLKDCLKQFSTEVIEHLVEELKELTKLVINGGTKAATIDGSAWAFLGSPNKGRTWSGIPA
jgi:hypothetical protein